ncbi:hypothetical protein ACFWHF_12125 [Streptomyces griseoincarnatus]
MSDLSRKMFLAETAAVREHLAEQEQQATAKAEAVDLPTLAAALDGLHTLIATSSRDWQTYRVDAWLWAVLCGWDCEKTEHDDTCVHGALEETAARHGWDEATVAKARRYRAAVRAVSEHQPAAGARQDGERPRCPQDLTPDSFLAPPVCSAYQPPQAREDSGYCARCGMYDWRHTSQPAAGARQDGAQQP